MSLKITVQPNADFEKTLYRLKKVNYNDLFVEGLASLMHYYDTTVTTDELKNALSEVDVSVREAYDNTPEVTIRFILSSTAQKRFRIKDIILLGHYNFYSGFKVSFFAASGLNIATDDASRNYTDNIVRDYLQSDFDTIFLEETLWYYVNLGSELTEEVIDYLEITEYLPLELKTAIFEQTGNTKILGKNVREAFLF